MGGASAGRSVSPGQLSALRKRRLARLLPASAAPAAPNSGEAPERAAAAEVPAMSRRLAPPHRRAPHAPLCSPSAALRPPHSTAAAPHGTAAAPHHAAGAPAGEATPAESAGERWKPFRLSDGQAVYIGLATSTAAHCGAVAEQGCGTPALGAREALEATGGGQVLLESLLEVRRLELSQAERTVRALRTLRCEHQANATCVPESFSVMIQRPLRRPCIIITPCEHQASAMRTAS